MQIKLQITNEYILTAVLIFFRGSLFILVVYFYER